MFGKNPIRHVTRDPQALAVESIFYTIQGEGPYSGMPAIFIRMAGCNLACSFCDTEFETQADRLQTVEQVMADFDAIYIAAHFATTLVVLTGGEPFRQDVTALIQALLDRGIDLIQAETAGTLWHEGLHDFVANEDLVIVCSPKTTKVNPHVASHCWHWKYIIKAGEQGEYGLPAISVQPGSLGKKIKIAAPWLNEARPFDDVVWVSPCDEHDAEMNAGNLVACLDTSLKYGYRISLQTHKLLGVE